MRIKGSIIRKWLDSKLLAGNPAGVPAQRPLVAYVPSHHTGDAFPVLYCLAPWTSAGRTLLDFRPFKESLPERLERLVGAGAMAPAIVVCPDLYTDFGGSQYIDSEFFGPQARHIIEEIIPFVEAELPVMPGKQHRGVFGRSSGGFGALRLAMDFPDAVSAVGCHSGDMGFEIMIRGDLITLANGLSRFDQCPQKFIQYTSSSAKLSSSDIHLLMLLGSAGFYSPNLSNPNGFDLPIDLTSGAMNQSVWQRWLRHDPVVRLKSRVENLRRLNFLYVECGQKDQFNLLYGARQLHHKLNECGISHRYQEFDDNHSGTDYRYDVSLPGMIDAIS